MFCKYLLLLLCLFSASSWAQPGAPGTANQLAEMKKLDFLLGSWKGSGYFEFGPGKRKTFTETENIQKKLGGLVLFIEGEGLAGGEKPTPIHSALALVSYDEQSKNFKWYAYRAGSGALDTTAKVGDNTLEWGFADPHAGNIRFVIKLNEKGQWFETGEASRDGATWQKFFEMTLDRVAPESK
ncbi:MAG TPA: DUF1579 family protein [Candidatus Angelobacter sp.]|nr:DUF1579 family protein [Candidatus Angelobacter sp.]